MSTTLDTAQEETIDTAAEQIVRYFVPEDGPERKTHKRSVMAILGRHFPVVVRGIPVVSRTATVTPAGPAVLQSVPVSVPRAEITEPVVLYDAPETDGVKRVPHVRGDVPA